MLIVARPRVGWIGIEQPPDFIQQAGVGTLAGANRVQMLWYQSGAYRFDF